MSRDKASQIESDNIQGNQEKNSRHGQLEAHGTGVYSRSIGTCGTIGTSAPVVQFEVYFALKGQDIMKGDKAPAIELTSLSPKHFSEEITKLKNITIIRPLNGQRKFYRPLLIRLNLP